MRKLTGILATIMLFVMVFANSVFAATFTDVNDSTQYKNAIMTLTSVGVLKGYEDGSFRPEANITRAEFTVMVTRVMAVDNIKVEGLSFSDASEHYAKYNIKTAYDMGIINGFEDGSFKPDENVTYEQAIKMVVCMLGYEGQAIQQGGWPTGYMGVATQLGLTKNISILNTSNATRGVISQVFDSALNINLQKRSVLSNGDIKYESTNDTIMSSKLKIEKVRATIIGVGDTHSDPRATSALNHEMSILTDKNEEMIVDYTTHFNSIVEAKQYLGYQVIVYYKDQGNSELATVISVDQDTSKNTVININTTDIESYNGTQLKYYKNEAATTTSNIKINADSLSVIYNGKSISGQSITVDGNSYTLSEALSMWLDPDSEQFAYGEIKITDAGSDGTVDILVLNNYKIIVASKAPAAPDYRITDKLVSGHSVVLDPESTQYTCNIFKNNQQSKVTSIAANDVVMYAVSLDEEVYTAYVTSSPVTGTISEWDQAEQLIKVNDKKYDVLDSCIKNLEGKSSIKVGIKGTFYIDKFENIVYCTLTADKASSYGYLINSYRSSDQQTYYANVFQPSTGKVATYPMKGSVKLNGGGTSAASVSAKLKETAPRTQTDIVRKDEVYGSNATKVDATEYAQPVKIDIASNTVNSFISIDDTEKEVNEDMTKLVRYRELDKYKYTATGNFNNEFYINSSTTIIYVPGDRNNSEEYMKGTSSKLFKTNESYWVEPYDVNASKNAGLLMVYGNSPTAEITKDTPFAFIQQVVPKISSLGNDVLQVKHYTSDKMTTMVNSDTADDDEFKDVLPGDIIRYGTNNKGNLINNQVVLNFADISSVLKGGNFDWNDAKFDYAVKNSNGDIELDAESQKPYSRIFLANVAENSIDEENKYIVFTKNGFDESGALIEGNTERYEIPAGVKMLRYDVGKGTYTTTVSGSSTALSIEADLKDVKYQQKDCSKVLVIMSKDQIKGIILYDNFK